jgi:phosphoglucomutase
MPATFTRDKDAITSAAYIADLAALAASTGKNLHALLQDLYRQFGYYQESVKNVTLPGREGSQRIQAMMAALRSSPPARLGGRAVKVVGDMMTGIKKDASSGQVVEKLDLPPSDVMLFVLDDGTKAIVRPSGTEPKIKFYVLTREPGDDLPHAKAAATDKLNAVIRDLEQRAQA